MGRRQLNYIDSGEGSVSRTFQFAQALGLVPDLGWAIFNGPIQHNCMLHFWSPSRGYSWIYQPYPFKRAKTTIKVE